jgi:hypothetical protein
VLERFEEERLRMLPLPEVGFRAERVVLVEASRRALVGVEGAWYSVPTSWHSLEVTAYVGPREVRLECRGESVSHRRQSFGSRSVRYRHYLSELARKPQALRQVAAELLGELGEPYGRLWRMLVDAHGPREAARVFARVLGAVCDHGEEAVAEAIGTALAAHRHDLLALAEALQTRSLSNPVPATLAEHHIESASVADYDRLLLGEEGR